MKHLTYSPFFRLSAVIALSLSLFTASAQTVPAEVPAATVDSVKAAVNRLFTAMKNADGAELKASFADSAILQTILTDKEGKTTGAQTYPVNDFANTINHLPNGAADERVSFDVVRIDGSLAIVWAPYKFYYNGKLTHCGIDSFQLLRVNGVWKIQYIIDTRRKECE